MSNNSVMVVVAPESERVRDAPVPLLFLIADTGGGHRAAARAVTEALETAYPDRFAPVLCDPLGGEDSRALLRWVTGLYGPSIRLAPWTWGAIYYASDSRLVMGVLRRTILALANHPVRRAAATARAEAIVSFHPLVGGAAVQANLPVVTVVTDLITPHMAWRYNKADLLLVPSASVRWRCHLDGISPERCVETGLPVGSSFAGGPLRKAERAALRRSLGLAGDRFLVVLTGGGEGSGGMARRAAALVERLSEDAGVDVVAICGRNARLEAKLRRRAAGTSRLVVKGFVDNMADWLRAADVVVSKAGPGTIAEATCCGAPLLVTSHVPGQEKGNTEFVVGAGAGLHVPGVDELVAAVDELRRAPGRVEAMRIASARLGRPHAADDIARRLGALFGIAEPESTGEPVPAVESGR